MTDPKTLDEIPPKGWEYVLKQDVKELGIRRIIELERLLPNPLPSEEEIYEDRIAHLMEISGRASELRQLFNITESDIEEYKELQGRRKG